MPYIFVVKWNTQMYAMRICMAFGSLRASMDNYTIILSGLWYNIFVTLLKNIMQGDYI